MDQFNVLPSASQKHYMYILILLRIKVLIA